MMQGVMDDGSGRVIRRMGFNHPAAGKTGTTNAFRDAWFTGFTKDLTTSVWVGYDDNESMFRPNEKGVSGAHAAAPIWGLVMEQALKDSGQVNFPVPSKIRFEYANISDGFYESKKSKTTVKVALINKNVLPRHSAPLVVDKVPKRLEVVKLERKPSPSPQAASRPIKVKHNPSNMDSKIWFMINLENASMGKLKKIPTSWFIQMLRDTRDIKTSSPERLSRGRKVLIEKLLSRQGLFKNRALEGAKVKALFRPSEAKEFGVQLTTEN